MARLSIIIVNYNVEYFLEQCLHSVRKACYNLDTEVWVVDNDSVDGSVKMVRDKFPEVKLIANSENLGFSKANNQAMRLADGEYFLLLNPDTIVEEDTFSKILGFMDAHPEAGGLGVKMVDGKGDFLPESKRGLPTPAVSFYKMSGLSKIFPTSKTFGQYHLSFLNKDEIHAVDILAGAFMMLRKSVLDTVGLLDEDYFMYGEDIDLSWRIVKAGYKNYYYPETRIIHYKGESTRKSSINYVFTFYNAMRIFSEKHFSKKHAVLFSLIINLAIYFRASLSICKRFAQRIFLPLFDAILLYAGALLMSTYWEGVIFSEGVHYPPTFLWIVLPVYSLTWIISVYLSGGYDRPFRLLKVYQGIFFGTMTILVVYALLSEEFRFSRALILFGAGWGLLAMTGLRMLLHLSGLKNYKIGSDENRRYIVIGNPVEAERVAGLLRQTHAKSGFIGLVKPESESSKENGFIGHIGKLDDILQIYQIDEVVFCAKDLSAISIIDLMAKFPKRNIDFKIAPPESQYIIGSNSIAASGDLYIIDVNSISKSRNRRNKRLLDLIFCLGLLVILPLSMVLAKNPLGLIKNIVLVLIGKKTWVGYFGAGKVNKLLPLLHEGVLGPGDAWPGLPIDDETADKLNLLYSRDYRIINDINIIYKAFRQLGRQMQNAGK
jgi:GT2 family glycosyltransferase